MQQDFRNALYLELTTLAEKVVLSIQDVHDVLSNFHNIPTIQNRTRPYGRTVLTPSYSVKLIRFSQGIK